MTWIKCSEKMPENQTPVNIYATTSNASGIGKWKNNKWEIMCVKAGGIYLDNSHFDNISHWMPLPNVS